MLACSNDTNATPTDDHNNISTNAGEERKTTLKESIYGFDIMILPGFALKESQTGKSYITMDTDKNFEVRITNVALGDRSPVWLMLETLDVRE